MSTTTRSSRSPLRVLALEPYFGLSHRTFLEGYRKFSRHAVEIWSLPARKWKWRMRGAAFHFAELAASTAASSPDVILASDFLNLPDWRALAPRSYRDLPCILYFHENQVTYPLGDKAPRDFHYGWINLSSALAAERVLFNSSYHREAFLGEVARILRLEPDPVPAGLVDTLRERSGVFPVGVDLEPHRAVLRREDRRPGQVPAIVWNHRWEYDKDPDLLVEALVSLKRAHVPFRLVVCGQSFKQVPGAFERASVELKEETIHMGFFQDHRDYLSALHASDIVLSTARQEFFGVSVVEAMALGCLPVLPRALSYPEIIPEHLHGLFLYETREDLPRFLRAFLAKPPLEHREAIQRAAGRFDWKVLAPSLDRIVDETHEHGRA